MSPIVIPDEATLRRALESVVRAPSVYNSQPWRWRISPTDGVDLFADPDRHLMAIDLDGRDVLLSCGAALHHLVVALAGLGWSARIDRFPDPENTHHLARVRPSTATAPLDTAALAQAIPRRRTDRRRLSAEPVDEGLRAILLEHAASCGAELHVVAGSAARQRLIEVIAHSASLQRQQWVMRRSWRGGRVGTPPRATGSNPAPSLPGSTTPARSRCARLARGDLLSHHTASNTRTPRC